MRTITTELTVYPFDELNSAAQAKAIEQVQGHQITQPLDTGDIELISCTILYILAEKLGAPGWDTFGSGDFPGIARVQLTGWDLDRGQSLTVAGVLDRDNAPALRGSRGSSQCSWSAADRTAPRSQSWSPNRTAPAHRIPTGTPRIAR